MEISNPKHRRYRVESLRDNFMIVKRVADGETFTCPTYNIKIDYETFSKFLKTNTQRIIQFHT